MSEVKNNFHELTYEKAGVSIERGQAAVEALRPWAAMTRRPEVMTDIGGFAGGFKLGDTELLAGADGVGSKILIAEALGVYHTIGIDLVAMNVNDVLAAGGEPLFFLDYIAMGRVTPERVTALVRGMAEGCQAAGCALLGGETAEMPDVYPGDGCDVSGFAVGRRRWAPADPPIQRGDVVVGLLSSGFHANGYQLIRHIVQTTGHGWTETLPELDGQSLGEALLTPTRIYVRPVMTLWEQVHVKAMAHITGGGLVENVPRTLGSWGAVIEWDRWPHPSIMNLIQEWGRLGRREMVRTFNGGIGFTVVVDKEDVDQALSILAASGTPAYPIGEIVDQPGVVVQ
ncbi:MAG: phosphoribosylformylglycinamidine cyclo-ligase [Firmicutes bacterium]|nr:phosphoribosylformylglycinamidine cyclo-ligase [Bacillota bacterium]